MYKEKSKQAIITIPLSTRKTLTDIERISLKQAIKIFSDYKIVFVLGSSVEVPEINNLGFELIRFPDKYFGSVANYNKLMVSLRFYNTFSEYSYVLIYHLDAFVFRDELAYWCSKGFDLIAPPWLKDHHGDWYWLKESAIGNGGFSLRKTSTFISILSSKRKWDEPGRLSKRFIKGKSYFHEIIRVIFKVIFNYKFFNNINLHLWYFIKKKKFGEDRFFALHGSHYYPKFELPSINEAIGFGFETYPKELFKLNKNRLPFGCHNFEEYMSFWEAYIIDKTI